MPTIKTTPELSRSPSSSILKLSIVIEFTDFEQREDLHCWVKAALYERDAHTDKVFFWTNGSKAHVHSWTQTGKDKKDQFITFFKGITIKPSDSRVSNGKFEFETSIDLDDPALRAKLFRADDPIVGDGPHLGSERWEELRAVVHAYNELAPSTAVSREHNQTDIRPG